MFIVAIAKIEGEVEHAIRPLSEALGTTAYELKLVFNAGLPAIVRVTADESQALSAKKAIAAFGHWPILCRRSDVVQSARTRELRNFRFAPEGLVPEQGSNQRLSYDDVSVLLSATHRTTSETSEQVKERQFRPMAAVLSGGLILTKTTKRTVTSTTARIEQVLYIFSRSQPPYLLRERSANYTELGARRSPTSFENFNTTIEILRSRCPAARYDERLRTNRPIRGVAEGVEATDIYAHILSEYLSQCSPR